MSWKDYLKGFIAVAVVGFLIAYGMVFTYIIIDQWLRHSCLLFAN